MSKLGEENEELKKVIRVLLSAMADVLDATEENCCPLCSTCEGHEEDCDYGKAMVMGENILNGDDEDANEKPDPGDERIVSLTKREWFAGMAMQGLINGCGDIINKTSLTSISVELADATIAALESPGEEKKTEAAVAIKVKGQSSFLIEADELRKKIEFLIKNIPDLELSYSEGSDDALGSVLNEINLMTGKK